ncbi:MAG: hypothetical protein ACOYNS_08345 [Bacteroidota bacterium]
MKIFILLVMGLSMMRAESRTERYVGSAVDLKSGKLIYTEEHEAFYDNEVNVRSVITYRDEKKNIIGKKEINFNGTSSVASFRREDYRYGTIESAEQVSTGIKLLNKKDGSSSAKEEIVSIPKPFAIDAGLNNLVRNNWDALGRNENVMFYLGVPSQLDYYQFRLVNVREEMFLGRKSRVIRFESDHWFIRLFVDPVVVWYDTETRRAVKYEGISNLYNEQGKSYVVRVTFDKPGP